MAKSAANLVCGALVMILISPSESAAEAKDTQIARVALLEAGRVLERGPWRRLLASEDNDVRVEAVRAIGRIQEQDLASLIEANLGHEDESLRRAAATAFSQISGMGPSPLREQLKVEKRMPVSGALLTALGHLGGIEDAVYLLRVLEGFAPELRPTAILAVARIARANRDQLDKIKPKWNAVLKPEDPSMQRYAWAYLLVVWRDKLTPDAHVALTRCLNDYDVEVRRVCVTGLGHIPERVTERHAATKDPDWRIRVAAARALVKAKDFTALKNRLGLLLDAMAAGTIKFQPPAAHEVSYLLNHAHQAPMDDKLQNRVRVLYAATTPLPPQALRSQQKPVSDEKKNSNTDIADAAGTAKRDSGKTKAQSVDAGSMDAETDSGKKAPAGSELTAIGEDTKAAATDPAAKVAVEDTLDSGAERSGNVDRSYLNCAAASLLDRAIGKPKRSSKCGGPEYPKSMREAWMVKATVDLLPDRRAMALKKMYKKFSEIGRLAIIDVVSKIPISKTSEAILTEAINGAQESVIGAAAAAVADMKLKSLGEILVDSYQRAYKRGKYAAVQSIFDTFGQLELVETHQILEAHSNDAQPGVRNSARRALKRVDRALRRLENENGFVGVLGVGGRRSKIPPPADMMAGQTPDPRLARLPEFTETILHTTAGEIHIRFFVKAARNTVKNFIKLAKRDFYDKLVFHRVVPGFVVQVGDPTGTGWGGPGYTIPCEYNGRPFLRGTVGMALSGKDTGGSQFFIAQSRSPHLDGSYTAFGEVIDGQEVVDRITSNDLILRVELLSKR
jgi:cyclophilin family peptidyl-prolyl cis-trans isomerase/HEAT repeat protein